MSSPTVEELERLLAQLPPREQLQLLARMLERLSAELPQAAAVREPQERYGRQPQPLAMEAWLAECDQVAELWQGAFDAAAEVRRLREGEKS